jgi:hypothetical protein
MGLLLVQLKASKLSLTFSEICTLCGCLKTHAEHQIIYLYNALLPILFFNLSNWDKVLKLLQGGKKNPEAKAFRLFPSKSMVETYILGQ